jgi:hypothetical protein
MKTKRQQKAETREVKKMVLKNTGKSLDQIAELLNRAEKELRKKEYFIAIIGGFFFASIIVNFLQMIGFFR